MGSEPDKRYVPSTTPTAQEDVVTGMPQGMRSQSETKSLVTTLVKSLPLAGALAGLGALTGFSVSSALDSPDPHSAKLNGAVVIESAAVSAENDIYRASSFSSSATVHVPGDTRSSSRALTLLTLYKTEYFFGPFVNRTNQSPEYLRARFSILPTDSGELLTMQAWGETGKESEQLLLIGLEEFRKMDQQFFSGPAGDPITTVHMETLSGQGQLEALDPLERNQLVYRLLSRDNNTERQAVMAEIGDSEPAIAAAVQAARDSLEVSISGPIVVALSGDGTFSITITADDSTSAGELLEETQKSIMESPVIDSLPGEALRMLVLGVEEPSIAVPPTIDPTIVATATGAFLGLLGTVAFALRRARKATPNSQGSQRALHTPQQGPGSEL